MRVAIQGQAGSFHHQVATQWFGPAAQIIAGDSFAEVFGAMNRHDADVAVVAVENSLYGSINEVYDLIESHRYPIIGEVYLRVQQHLIGLPGAALADIQTVYSHPVALAQCDQFLDATLPRAQRSEYHDTAAAVELIAAQHNKHHAAIASHLAAKLHDLPILVENIENHHANYTRFFILAPQATPTTQADKASLVIETDHSPGALARVLNVFAEANVNVTKLMSRPIVGKIWTYRFYIDLEVAGPSLTPLLAQITADAATVTILGQYKRDSLPTSG